MTEPTVVDVTATGEQLLARVEYGDVSVVVSAPRSVSREDLETAFANVPGPAVEYGRRMRPVETSGRDDCSGGEA